VTIENEVEAMRTARFSFIFVLRRKDGDVMSADDKNFVRLTTANANRRSLSGDGRAVIVGSNYRLPPETVEVLGERFALEDMSGPAGDTSAPSPPANANM
jgi:hypothetical protein